MYLKRKKYFLYLLIAGLCFNYKAAIALEFKPGVGFGLEYTDNSRLAPSNEEYDLVAIAFVGASLEERKGPLQYQLEATLSEQDYSNDTFEDQGYLQLSANADWEAIEERLTFSLRDRFTQQSILAVNTNTPNNVQDSNVFVADADILFPVSARQSYGINTTYRQYYYETSTTDNEQYGLALNWSYQLFRLTNVQLSASINGVKYTEEGSLGETLPKSTFTRVAAIVSGERAISRYSVDVGATNVKREGEEDFSGATGGALWTVDVSSRSKFRAKVSSKLTDTSRASSAIDGNDVDVQLVSDVVRDSDVDLSYSRQDVDLESRVWARYRKLDYNITPFDQNSRTVGVALSFPGTQLFSSRLSVRYKQVELVSTGGMDDNVVVEGGFNYQFSRKIKGVFSLKYLTKESLDPDENYDELSVFASLIYGYGKVPRSLRGDDF